MDGWVCVCVDVDSTFDSFATHSSPIPLQSVHFTYPNMINNKIEEKKIFELQIGITSTKFVLRRYNERTEPNDQGEF